MKMIACVDQKTLALGNNNKLLFTCKEDMARFKSYTMGKMVVMGSKTFESIGGPLKGRFNIVITTDPSKYKEYNDVVFLRFYQFLEMMELWGWKNSDDVFVIGGGKIYEALLKYCDTVYLTEVIRDDFDLQYDSSFPEDIKDRSKWRLYHGGKIVKGSFSWTNENDEEVIEEIYFKFYTYKKVINKNNRRIGG